MAKEPLLAFDVGGSFIKAGLVDLQRGRVVREIEPEPTPAGGAPEAVLDLLATIAGRLPAAGPVGFAFPSVAKRGVARTAANVDRRWIGTNAASLLEQRIGRPVVFLNDADAAGVAEMSFGAGQGRDEVVMLLTLGTGIGSALFVDGRLMPNTELGHLEFAGMEAETRASGRARIERKLDWAAYMSELSFVIQRMHALFWPDLIVLCGGITADHPNLADDLDSPAPLKLGALRADAGIVGAALATTLSQGVWNKPAQAAS